MPVPGRPLSKATLRRQALAARAALPDRAEGDRLRDLALAPLLAGRTVAAYAPFGTEPVPPDLGADVLLPVLLPDRDLSWRTPDGPDLGVDAVAACDVVLVPALRVDRRGVRLGRGGGSYDRALARARARRGAAARGRAGRGPARRGPRRAGARGRPAVRRRGPDPLTGLPPGLADRCHDRVRRRPRRQPDYAETFQDEGKPGQAAKGLAVVTCMDSRIEPLAMLGMERGDVKIIRNAGARVTSDVLRTLVLANTLLNVDRVLVVPHTECAMTGKTEDDVQRLLGEKTGVDARSLHFSVMPDQRAALERDVQRIRSGRSCPRTSWSRAPSTTSARGRSRSWSPRPSRRKS